MKSPNLRLHKAVGARSRTLDSAPARAHEARDTGLQMDRTHERD